MTTLREAIARRIAARQTGVACRTGIGLPDDIWRHVLPDADDALAAIEAAGWAVVPKEPTREMNLAANKIACERYDPHAYEFHVTFGEFEAMWELALAAAPKPGGEQ